jgi:type II secretory pathway pseudopilin PulG
MIELIFVIVILGILAAVAIPKLMATRTDAKIAAISQETGSVVSEVPAYVTSQGKVTNFLEMSQVAKSLVDQNKAYDSAKKKGNSDAKDDDYKAIANSKDVLYIGAQDDDGNLQPCIILDVNSTTLKVTHSDKGTGAICKGVQQRVKEAEYTVAGSSVKF